MSRPADLLKELSINRDAEGRKKKRRIWPIVLIVGLVIIGGLYVMKMMKPAEVETTKAISAAESGPASVLDASGYVTARRIATATARGRRRRKRPRPRLKTLPHCKLRIANCKMGVGLGGMKIAFSPS